MGKTKSTNALKNTTKKNTNYKETKKNDQELVDHRKKSSEKVVDYKTYKAANFNFDSLNYNKKDVQKIAKEVGVEAANMNLPMDKLTWEIMKIKNVDYEPEEVIGRRIEPTGERRYLIRFKNWENEVVVDDINCLGSSYRTYNFASHVHGFDEIENSALNTCLTIEQCRAKAEKDRCDFAPPNVLNRNNDFVPSIYSKMIDRDCKQDLSDSDDDAYSQHDFPAFARPYDGDINDSSSESTIDDEELVVPTNTKNTLTSKKRIRSHSEFEIEHNTPKKARIAK
eukprot:TRINITY_DN20824_c0_g1_i1.p1 TRINITY_DN20824_c0_g1~~TRINITY_DN20824_c0_g1_i1.p1  ORF type:complete len:282 (+),score=34.06 TRINITY_DN20824_c0_g1_i1:14-859(+)